MAKLYNFLLKDGDAIAVGFSAFMLILFALGVYFGSKAGGYDLSTLTELPDKSNINCFNIGLWSMIIMSIVAIILAILGMVWDIFKNFKSGSSSIYGFGAIVVAFLAFYFTSSHDSGGRFDAFWKPEFGITVGLSKFISAGLYSMMALTVVAFLLILIYEVKSFFK